MASTVKLYAPNESSLALGGTVAVRFCRTLGTSPKSTLLAVKPVATLLVKSIVLLVSVCVSVVPTTAPAGAPDNATSGTRRSQDYT